MESVPLVYVYIERNISEMALNIGDFAGRMKRPELNLSGERMEQVAKIIRLTQVLVVEDDLPTASVIVTFIQSSGYSVSLVSDASQAVEYASSNQVDVVLLDTSRLTDNGVALTAALRASRPEVIIIAIVQRRSQQLVAALSQRGVDDYVTQPLDLSDLVFRMRVLLAKSEGAPNNETLPITPALSPQQTAAITQAQSSGGKSQTAPLRALMTRKYAVMPPIHAPVEIYTLGSFKLLVEGRVVCDDSSGGRRAMQLLKYLIASLGKRVRKERIADLLWPDLPGDLAANNLRGTLHTLRGILAADDPKLRNAILTERSSLCLDIGDDYYYDVQQFNTLLDQASATERTGRLDDAIAIYEQIISVYRGAYLEMEEDVEWIIYEREQLRERFASVLVRLADLYIETGNFDDAIAVAQRAIQEDWRREAAHRVLMVAFYKSERRNQALITYQNVVDSFKAKLGIAPMQQTRDLAAQILREEAI